jgi:NitT/TauT family transport system substrate-binding protein
MKSKSARLSLVLALLACVALPGAHAAEKKSFKFAWSIYAGFMPWVYAEQSGILKKWADKYGITIELTQFNDYVESINQYTAGEFDGVLAAQMDALTIPAAGGVDTTVLILGDYSNGNDGLAIKGQGKTLADLKGLKVSLVELSVSHYLLARALAKAGLAESDVKTENISDADYVPVWNASETVAIAAWKPGLSTIQASPDASMVFDSAQIPGEIMDVAVVNTATLSDNPAFGKALVGAWYETLAAMRGDGETAKAARTLMAEASGTDLAGYDSQIATTYLYHEPAEAVAFMRDPKLTGIMDLVTTFAFEHGLLGEGAKSKDVIGIALPDGKVLGDAANVKLRFDATYTALAADGKL